MTPILQASSFPFAGLVGSLIAPRPRAIAPTPLVGVPNQILRTPRGFRGIPRQAIFETSTGPRDLLTGGDARKALIKAILLKIAIRIGRKLTIKAALAVMKRLGINAALESLGISGQEAAVLIISRPKRRARGITAANLRTTRRTLRKVASLAADLSEFTTRTRILRAPRKR